MTERLENHGTIEAHCPFRAKSGPRKPSHYPKGRNFREPSKRMPLRFWGSRLDQHNSPGGRWSLNTQKVVMKSCKLREV